MNFDFKVNEKVFDQYRTEDLYLNQNYIFKTKKIICENYLYPCYYTKVGNLFYISTSVYSLSKYLNKVSRNYKFQNHYFIQPTFKTVFNEIKRAKPKREISSNNISSKDDMIKISSELIQEYISYIEYSFPNHRNLLLMGGKDSQIISLTKRKNIWDIMTGEPNCKDNQFFLEKNKIEFDNFIKVSNKSSNKFLKQEINSMDCFYDIAHLRYVDELISYKKKYGDIIIWMGSGADGILAFNKSFLFDDWFDFWQLHVGMMSGIMHSAYKNILDCPVISPYQSRSFMEKFFFKYNRNSIQENDDLRPDIANQLYKKQVIFPKNNFTPREFNRQRYYSINSYINCLIKEKVEIKNNWIFDNIIRNFLFVFAYIDTKSKKKRGLVSKLLYYIRLKLSIINPKLKVNRYSITEF